MPELPEVETARAVIERAALDRRIVDVDDADTFVLRPHLPGDVRAALVGRRLTPAQFRGAMTRGDAPVKARLLDQHALAGVGNLLADEILWLARINPARSTAELSGPDVDRLLRGLRRAVRTAIESGGVHALSIV